MPGGGGGVGEGAQKLSNLKVSLMMVMGSSLMTLLPHSSPMIGTVAQRSKAREIVKATALPLNSASRYRPAATGMPGIDKLTPGTAWWILIGLVRLIPHETPNLDSLRARSKDAIESHTLKSTTNDMVSMFPGIITLHMS